MLASDLLMAVHWVRISSGVFTVAPKASALCSLPDLLSCHPPSWVAQAPPCTPPTQSGQASPQNLCCYCAFCLGNSSPDLHVPDSHWTITPSTWSPQTQLPWSPNPMWLEPAVSLYPIPLFQFPQSSSYYQELPFYSFVNFKFYSSSISAKI